MPVAPLKASAIAWIGAGTSVSSNAGADASRKMLSGPPQTNGFLSDFGLGSQTDPLAGRARLTTARACVSRTTAPLQCSFSHDASPRPSTRHGCAPRHASGAPESDSGRRRASLQLGSRGTDDSSLEGDGAQHIGCGEWFALAAQMIREPPRHDVREAQANGVEYVFRGAPREAVNQHAAVIKLTHRQRWPGVIMCRATRDPATWSSAPTRSRRESRDSAVMASASWHAG